jgi:serine/threonine-protein kinase
VVLPQESGGVCPQCRTPLEGSVDETRLAPDSSSTPAKTSPTSSGVRHSSGSSGWLSSSGAIDHGRFLPGAILGGRYRVVGRLGRGGMGEVYRADDLKLGQPVALKFLPPEVDRDPAKLMQLHTEVRMARQVSHPNVCRVYDIDEVDGHTFLSMEYIDGEDLSSLLKRIGRFPSDRALEIARQICAGLAAAHERGIIHRDFKPANVMLDGSGKVRITDFGLAGASGEAIRAGTPAYMAPEQLAGSEVTARSDIYSLGLVLYEIFTGQRALEGKNLAELINKREQAAFVPPSALVKDLEPEIERTILRCLQLSPSARPASALAVAAALPGGDPLAAALAVTRDGGGGRHSRRDLAHDGDRRRGLGRHLADRSARALSACHARQHRSHGEIAGSDARSSAGRAGKAWLRSRIRPRLRPLLLARLRALRRVNVE